MKPYLFSILLLFFSKPVHSQAPPALMDAMWDELFRGTLTESHFARLDTAIEAQDPAGKYPEWKLRAYTLQGWFGFEYDSEVYTYEKLITQGNAYLDARDALGKGTDRKEWILAKANFYEWAGRVTRTMTDDKYRTLLYLYKAYSIKRHYFPENHPEILRLQFFFAFHNHNIAEAVTLSEVLYRAYQQDSTLKKDPFAMYFETSYLYYKIELNDGVKEITSDSLRRAYIHNRESAFLNMAREWGEKGIYLRHLLGTLVKLLKEYGPDDKYRYYQAELDRLISNASEEQKETQKSGSPPKFYVASNTEFETEPARVLAATHKYMAFYNPFVAEDNILTPLPQALPKEKLEEMAPFWFILGQKTFAFGRAFLSGANLPANDSLRSLSGWADMCQHMILHLLENHRIRTPEYFNINFHRHAFKEGFRASVALYQSTGDQKWLEKAYSQATFGKNFRLYALHLTEERFSYSEEIKSLSNQIRKHSLAAENFRNSGYLQHFDSLSERFAQVFQLVKQQDSLLFRLRDRELNAVFKTFRPNLISSLQQKLAPEEAVLEFFPDSSFLAAHGALLVKKDTIVWQTFSEDFLTLKKQVTDLNKAIATQATDYQRSSRQLYGSLIAPFEDQLQEVDHLYILPNDTFNELPFSALLDSNQRFLIERFTLANHFNARLLAENIGLELDQVTNFSGFAPFGIEKMANGESFPPALRDWLAVRLAHAEDSNFLQMTLPATHREVNSISQHYPERKIFTEKMATESQFKDVVKTPSILHLASHAVVDRNDLSFSRLLFYPSDRAGEDGALHLYELPYLKIKSPLVVLSACQTGVAGQGWLNKRTYSDLKSLAYGFYSAGVSNQLVSLWNIADEPSAFLMERFHFYLTEGRLLARSLQLAQRDYQHNTGLPERLRHPYFWAGYRLIGTNQPIETSSFRSQYGRSLIAFFLGLSFLLIWRLNSKSTANA